MLHATFRELFSNFTPETHTTKTVWSLIYTIHVRNTVQFFSYIVTLYGEILFWSFIRVTGLIEFILASNDTISYNQMYGDVRCKLIVLCFQILTQMVIIVTLFLCSVAYWILITDQVSVAAV